MPVAHILARAGPNLRQLLGPASAFLTVSSADTAQIIEATVRGQWGVAPEAELLWRQATVPDPDLQLPPYSAVQLPAVLDQLLRPSGPEDGFFTEIRPYSTGGSVVTLTVELQGSAAILALSCPSALHPSLLPCRFLYLQSYAASWGNQSEQEGGCVPACRACPAA